MLLLYRSLIAAEIDCLIPRPIFAREVVFTLLPNGAINGIPTVFLARESQKFYSRMESKLPGFRHWKQGSQ
jgi:hypothetical protein